MFEVCLKSQKPTSPRAPLCTAAQESLFSSLIAPSQWARQPPSRGVLISVPERRLRAGGLMACVVQFDGSSVLIIKPLGGSQPSLEFLRLSGLSEGFLLFFAGDQKNRAQNSASSTQWQRVASGNVNF